MRWTRLQQVKQWPSRRGKADYTKFLNGETLSRAGAIRAKCYECTCGDSNKPCTVETCPLIDHCPWNKNLCGSSSDALQRTGDRNSSDTHGDEQEELSNER